MVESHLLSTDGRILRRTSVSVGQSTVLSARAQGNLRRSQGLMDCPATRPDRNWKGEASRRLERDMVAVSTFTTGPRTLAGLRIGHSALGPRTHQSSSFVVRFSLSLSTTLSRPTSDPFSPDTQITIVHELYCLADSFVLTTHFIPNSLLFCLTTPSGLFPLVLG